MTYIFVFGDSSTYGAWDIEGGWVQRLRKFLDDKVLSGAGKKFFMVYNIGIDGHTTQDWISVFESELETRAKIAKKYNEPIIVIIELGGNDASFMTDKKQNRVSKEKFSENIKEMIEISKKITNNIICIGIEPCALGKTPEDKEVNLLFDNKYAEQYNKVLIDTCKKQGISFIDVFDKLKQMKNFSSFDDIHLSSEGHQKVFEIVKDFLIKNRLI